LESPSNTSPYRQQSYFPSRGGRQVAHRDGARIPSHGPLPLATSRAGPTKTVVILGQSHRFPGKHELAGQAEASDQMAEGRHAATPDDDQAVDGCVGGDRADSRRRGLAQTATRVLSISGPVASDGSSLLHRKRSRVEIAIRLHIGNDHRGDRATSPRLR